MTGWESESGRLKQASGVSRSFSSHSFPRAQNGLPRDDQERFRSLQGALQPCGPCAQAGDRDAAVWSCLEDCGPSNCCPASGPAQGLYAGGVDGWRWDEGKCCRAMGGSCTRAPGMRNPPMHAGMSPELKSSIDEFIAKNKIVVFMKGDRQQPQVRMRAAPHAQGPPMHQLQTPASPSESILSSLMITLRHPLLFWPAAAAVVAACSAASAQRWSRS
jgi:hypothetical protein